MILSSTKNRSRLKASWPVRGWASSRRGNRNRFGSQSVAARPAVACGLCARSRPLTIRLPHPDYKPYNKSNAKIVYSPPDHVIYWRNKGKPFSRSRSRAIGISAAWAANRSSSEKG